MNPRVLAFPLAAAAIAALDACAGVAPTDPSVRLCHDDTVMTAFRTKSGAVVPAMVIYHDDPTRCRKAA